MGTLSDGEVAAHIKDREWRREGDAIVRDFTFDDFRAAMEFANRVADLAEEVNQHPDILVHGFNQVKLSLSTHSEGGITDDDLAMAGRIDSL
jgi:4a-hydroxytetrahydrobiopterin dehydratase